MTHVVNAADFNDYETTVVLASGKGLRELKRMVMVVNAYGVNNYRVEYAYKFQLEENFDTLGEAIAFYNEQ